MPVLTAVYARSHTVGGIAIRFADFVGNRWSHCGIVTPEGTVIEARSFHGVVETSWTAFAKRYPGKGQKSYKDFQIPDPQAAMDWARTQKGKGYDYAALLGLALGRESWQEDDRWHCSELLETALVHGGRRRFIDDSGVISPNLSYMVI